MKFQTIAALAVVPTILAADYQVPELDYDNRDPTCDNVNTLIANTSADMTRLTNYVNVTLVKRASKLKDVYASVQKTCTIIKSKRPSLIQTTKLRTENVKTLQKLSQEVKEISKSLKCEKCKFQAFRSLVSLKTNDISSTDLCNEAFESIIDLKNYIEFLGPAITEKYIDGILADRIKDLQAFRDDCTAAACKHEEEEEDREEETHEEEDKEEEASEEEEDDNKPSVDYDPTKCEDEDYIGFTKKTSAGPGVITRVTGKTLAQLKEWCNARSDCLAFSSLGYMVNYILPYDQWTDRSNVKGYQFCVKRTSKIEYNPLGCEDENYIGFTQSASSGYGELAQLGAKPLSQLKDWCDARSDCVGFSSIGYMKNALLPYNQWADRSTAKNYQFCVKKGVDIVGYDETR